MQCSGWALSLPSWHWWKLTRTQFLTKVPLLLYLWNLSIVLFVHVFTCNSLPYKKLWKYSEPKWDPYRLNHFQTTTILISQLSELSPQEKIYAKIFKSRLLETQDQVKYLGKTSIIALFSIYDNLISLFLYKAWQHAAGLLHMQM